MKASIRISALVLIAMPSLALGQWQSDGVLLSAGDASSEAVHLVATTGDGAILVWATWNDNTNWDIYAQKLDGAGYSQWTLGGVPVCTAPRNQAFPIVASDGEGGVLVTWYDSRRGPAKWDVYVQRVGSTGVTMWTSDGVLLCNISNSTQHPQVTSDGAGGAIVTWADHRGTYYDIYAQRVYDTGSLGWTTNGVPVCANPSTQIDAFISSDASGGAIVVWADQRNSNSDIYTQRLNPSGIGLWALDGIPLSTAPGTQDPEDFVSDGAGGAIVCWHDWRVGISSDIYAQRVDGLGNTMWATDGVAVSTAPNVQYSSVVAPDGTGGAVFAWRDHRNGNTDIFAQRISDMGSPMWTPDGEALCTALGNQFLPAISSDAAHGAVVSWNDLRDGEYDAYAQRVDANGLVQWATDGIAVSATDSMETPPHSVSDGAGGAIFGWSDHRSGIRQAYARRINAAGEAPTPVRDTPRAPVISITAGHPNPFSLSTSFAIDLPVASAVQFDVFDVSGKRVRRGRSDWVAAGAGEIVFDGRDHHGRLLPSGVYFLRVRAAGETITRKMVIAR